LRQESQIDCRSNSPRHPDMDARSTSPPCTSAISDSVVKQQRLIKTHSVPRSAAASQRSSGLEASQPRGTHSSVDAPRGRQASPP
jgi:hypothetical protein